MGPGRGSRENLAPYLGADKRSGSAASSVYAGRIRGLWPLQLSHFSGKVSSSRLSCRRSETSMCSMAALTAAGS